ncbi:MAG: putative metal-binding motif-containing protein [Alphaproteobacteria bacterium]|nr:putative metal-binding motif-containing protein [Alphaproteobacteria bacterium]
MRTLPLLLLVAFGCKGSTDNPETGTPGDDTGTLVDEDGDGFPAADDCDDNDAAINPGASEVCDGLDNNCDGLTDEGVTTTFYADTDADGYGDDGAAVEGCAADDGYVGVGGDCDDTDPAYNPGASETDCADPNDYNCDGSVGYADNDGDGYAACEECDDSEAAVNPGAVEVCDEVDNNCDGTVDEGVTTTFYQDADGDGHGDPDFTTEACEQPVGYAATATDCDDADAAINPDAAEVCNGIDDDCDALVDDEDDSLDTSSASTWYGDGDGDGYGDADDARLACTQPSGTVSDDTDCDDDDGAVNPGATEVCNGIDDDCDALTDDDDGDVDLSTGSDWYTDGDGDGYGDAASSTVACDQPAGTSSDDSDCDDADASVNPGASEVCNSVDDDCSGTVDDNPTDGTTFYADDDCDDFGDPNDSVVACDQPAGYVTDDTDCDDAEGRSFPGAAELCSTTDNDCDGVADNDCETPIEIAAPSEVEVENPASPGACGLIGELTSSPNPHQRVNLADFMTALEGNSASYPLADASAFTVTEMDYSIRNGSNYTVAPGFYSLTNAWPTLSSTGAAGAGRFRGYINLNCGDPLNYTIGLIGNDALELDIEGATVIGVNWDDGQWVKFRYVSFPEPGLYRFEVRWSTNLCCSIDPMELIWVEGFEPGYDNYDTFCASSSCGSASTLQAIFDVMDDGDLVATTDGDASSCTQCASSAECASSEVCNSAGVCE